jgi:hypothetical protein
MILYLNVHLLLSGTHALIEDILYLADSFWLVLPMLYGLSYLSDVYINHK